MLNRRKFLTRSAGLAVGATLMHPMIVSAGPTFSPAQQRGHGSIDPRSFARSSELKAMVQKAIDTALTHGASYADAHVSLVFARQFDQGCVYKTESCGYFIGVRALKNGYWGFASAPWLSEEDIVRVAVDAATHAAGFGAVRPPRAMEFAPLSKVEHNGDWTTPVDIIPFEVDTGEVIDACRGMSQYYTRLFEDRYKKAQSAKWHVAIAPFSLGRADIVDATSDGSYTVQTFHFGQPGWVGHYIAEGTRAVPLSMSYIAVDTGLVPSLPPTRGWENYLQLPVEAIFDRSVEVYNWESSLPVKPVEVGKYDLLLDWQTMGQFIGASVGPATQLDRALGDHANGVGTSYLGPDIESYLGSVVASPHVTIRADRSTAGAEATVRWDSEGAVPVTVDLIKDGRLMTYQTGREGAGWLRNMDDGRATNDVSSAGFMGIAAGSASNVPLQHLPNLTLMPDPQGPSFDELLRSMKKGYLLRAGGVETDFQCLNGVIHVLPLCLYEVTNGKITAAVSGGEILFRTPELLSNIIALGGPESARWTTVGGSKGEPIQHNTASVSAVPALIKSATIVRRSTYGNE